MAYTIYCLVDPRSGLPYYIGATYRKLSLRLSSHLSHAKASKYLRGLHFLYDNRRNEVIYQLGDIGEKPLISALLVTDGDNVEACERVIYDYFINLGIDLIQSTYRFTYNSRIKTIKR